MNNYDDIINLQRPKSKYPQMTIEKRAAQFAPFAALNGFEDSIFETERITENRIDLEDETIENLNYKIQIIKDTIKNKPKVTVIYFQKDSLKNGGKYESLTDKVIKIDEYNNKLIFENGKIIFFNDIIDINCELFQNLISINNMWEK